MPGAHEFTRLRDTNIQSSESHQFARDTETVDIPDLAQYDGTQGIANAGDGGDIAAGLLQQYRELFFQFLDLGFQKSQLFHELPDLESKGVFSEVDAERTSCHSLELFCLLFAKSTMTGFSKRFVSFLVETVSISSGVGYWASTSLDVAPKVSENRLSYSGNT